MKNKEVGFGTAPVFFTAISTILGAILFLRFGFAVGTVGFWGVLLIVLVGHLVTLPTALAISEIATNQRVEGGGEYFIISRSFGLNIGATIGIALFLSQAISVAFYVIAFTEAFSSVFDWMRTEYALELPRQVVSVPAMLLLSVLIIKKGANLGVKALYVVVAILFISLVLFFLGKTDFSSSTNISLFQRTFRNSDQFFIVFAIIFPAFTGMTAGVGLSGDLKNPKKSIPLGTITATIVGMIIYVLVIWKLSGSASVSDLVNNQLIMGKIALFGFIIIPLGLAASTISSAIGSVLVAPRTIQAIGTDNSFPLRFLNRFFSKGKGELNEPINATVITCIIAMVFVILGDVNAVAKIISMFFMVTYGSICLISFLHHFGSSPSYRPTFRSRWFISLIGFALCLWLMVKMNAPYAFLSIIIMVLIYTGVTKYHKTRSGLETLFQGTIFQLSRRLQVYLQKSRKLRETWRPSAVCVSQYSFERNKAFELMNWISFKHGFGTYIHLIEGYYSKSTNLESKKVLNDLIKKSSKVKGNMYIDTMISPSYTSAIAQVLQLPSSSGMENNMIIFDYDKNKIDNIEKIADNISLAKAGDFDVCVLGCSTRIIKYDNGIHVWIRNLDEENANLMILLSYIILGHPDWENSHIKIFNVCDLDKIDEVRNKMGELILTGRLPLTEKNIDIIPRDENVSFKSVVNEYSKEAALTIVGFKEEQLKHESQEVFSRFDKVGDVLFIDAYKAKEIN
ncbi:amino acid permease [Bacteroidota bacterium]